MSEQATKQSPGSLDWVRDQIVRAFPGDTWVRELFLDHAIIERDGRDLIEVPWTLTDGEIVLGAPREVTIEYVAKSEGGARLTGPIVRKDAKRQIAYAPVLVPGEPDADGEVLSAEKIEEVAHTWLESFRAIDQMHEIVPIDAVPVESYLEPEERTTTTPSGDAVTLPQGTWVMAAKVRDEPVWKDIEAGERVGFSIMGVPRAALAEALPAVKSGDRSALKRITLADLAGGDSNGDWVAPFVSIVKRPAVPKAKWIALKSEADEPQGLLSRLLEGLRGEGAVKEGRRFSDSTYKQLKAATEALTALLAEADRERNAKTAGKAGEEEEMDEKQIKEIVEGALKSALTDELRPALDAYVTELASLAEPAGGEGGNGGKGDGKGDGDGGDGKGEGDDKTEALKAELDERLKKIEEKLAPASKGLPPGDAGGDQRPRIARDVYGRRIRTGV